MGQLHSYFGWGSICVGWHMCDGAHEDHRDNLISQIPFMWFLCFLFMGEGLLLGLPKQTRVGGQ